jgi:hypothetical protein
MPTASALKPSQLQPSDGSRLRQLGFLPLLATFYRYTAGGPFGYEGIFHKTVKLAWELRDTAIKMNTVNPGYTATDLNGNRGTQTLEEGAAEAFRQARAPDDAPTGGFIETGGVVPW